MVFGEVTNNEVKEMVDVSGRELTIFIPIVLLVVWLGVYPKPYLTAMEPALAKLISQVEKKP